MLRNKKSPYDPRKDLNCVMDFLTLLQLQD